jgi:hypothetical protein
MAIDPGRTTGVAEGHYSDTEPLKFTEIYVTTDGIEGFGTIWEDALASMDDFVVETFIPRANEFIANVDGVEVIGLIKGTMYAEARHVEEGTLHDYFFQARTEKGALLGAKESASEKANNAWLKDHGLWQTGSMVGWKDGRDANDAIIHALVHMKKIRHVPTLLHYWG